MNKQSTCALLSGILLSSSIVLADVSMSVIDSGTDVEHDWIKPHTWTKPNGLTDDPYTGDIHGRNFAESNNEILDRSLLGTFSPDPIRFFTIQVKVLNNTATEEDKQWVAEKRTDPTFMNELATFANFVHGTHVAGISTLHTDHSVVMGAKIIPTKARSTMLDFIHNIYLSKILFFTFNILDDSNSPTLTTEAPTSDDTTLKSGLKYLVSRQLQQLIPVGQYMKATEMRVANCSFGTGTPQAEQVITRVGHILLGRALTSAEVTQYTRFFMTEMIQQGTAFVSASPNTLFVIAAGNDNTNNDEKPTFPANLKQPNVITVAATRESDRLASFSSYGATTVDLAAPGVGIVSSIPTPQENESMPMSGTSQAAPQVTRVAGEILAVNPSLTPQEVKTILTRTTDQKSFLAGKVITGGLLNETRAIAAAQHSLSEDLDTSILHATHEVGNAVSYSRRFIARTEATKNNNEDGIPVEMPSLFKIE